jgi:hypothetical protein
MPADIRVLSKVFTLSLGLLSPHIPLFQWYPQSKDCLLNLSMKCCNSEWIADTEHSMFETMFNSSCTVRSSENICSSSGGAQEKRKDRMKLSLLPKLMVFWVSSLVECYCTFFAGFFLKSHPCVWPNWGFWCCVFLTLPITLLSTWVYIHLFVGR